MIRMLLDDSRTNYVTTFYDACGRGHLEIVELLLSFYSKIRIDLIVYGNEFMKTSYRSRCRDKRIDKKLD